MLHAINNNLNNRKKREVFRMKRKEERREKCNQCFLLCSPSPPIIGFFVCAVYNLLRDSAPKRTEKKRHKISFSSSFCPFPYVATHFSRFILERFFSIINLLSAFVVVHSIWWNFVHVNWLAFVPLQYRLIVASYELFFFVLCLVHTLTWRAYNLLER